MGQKSILVENFKIRKVDTSKFEFCPNVRNM